ncbi:alpha-crystallin A chain-like [Octopus sinensis]|uniref:Alpha-crystallin A chain-like n=1 Tax=Octopus sinensis TaxID=2607531 RepID=A0A6P7T0N7_9MOLL|nr:alpha-crystallin A chain-like [Octopus sinensis]
MRNVMKMGDSGDFLQRLLENSRVVKMKYNRDVFEVKLDVENYEPEDLCVKVQDEHLIVSGKHESKREDLGCVARQFTRQFLMPEDIDPDTLTSSLSPEGILTINGLIKRTSTDCGSSINIDHLNNVNESDEKTDRNSNRKAQHRICNNNMKNENTLRATIS